MTFSSLVESLPSGVDLVRFHKVDARPLWGLTCRGCAATITFGTEDEARRFATIDHRCKAAW